MIRCWPSSALCLLLSIVTLPCFGRTQGYVVGSISGLWLVSSFRAVETEDTPNVHSYGFSLSAGYALLNLAEIKALMSYRPLNASAGSLDHADGQQLYSGLELGLTSFEGLYLGLRYGLSQFSLPKTGDFDVSGKWQGFTAGVSLAGRWEMTSKRVWQIGVIFETSRLDKIPADPPIKKLHDAYILSVSHLFYSKF